MISIRPSRFWHWIRPVPTGQMLDRLIALCAAIRPSAALSMRRKDGCGSGHSRIPTT
ncbi:hypothetical protein [Pseudoruegeria sp. SK021]|uniref:hypothetical protein n=1 Tax=Pseudoruegeria sp. SK021 TaxID=1933035 RepID=UPI00197DFF0B|nr:hypothetical protein [Pseudoruegeria sp. SK021]